MGLLILAWVAIGAVGLGVLLKPSPSYWCPELPYPAWVLLYEIGGLVALFVTPIAWVVSFIVFPRTTPVRTRVALHVLCCLAVGACVLLGIEWSRLIPSGCG